MGCVTHTGDELSVVCPQKDIPINVKHQGGWRIIKILGILDFSLTGILLSLADPLARAGISIFAFSTYDTDYIMVQEGRLKDAVAALKSACHEFVIL